MDWIGGVNRLSTSSHIGESYLTATSCKELRERLNRKIENLKKITTTTSTSSSSTTSTTTTKEARSREREREGERKRERERD